MSKKYLSREEILNVNDQKTEEVSVPEWGGEVVVKAMSGTERDAFEGSILGDTTKGGQRLKMENVRAKLCAMTIIDKDTNELMFTVADIEALGKKSAAALDRIFSVSQRLSKISSDDVDDLIKN